MGTNIINTTIRKGWRKYYYITVLDSNFNIKCYCMLIFYNALHNAFNNNCSFLLFFFSSKKKKSFSSYKSYFRMSYDIIFITNCFILIWIVLEFKTKVLTRFDEFKLFVHDPREEENFVEKDEVFCSAVAECVFFNFLHKPDSCLWQGTRS